MVEGLAGEAADAGERRDVEDQATAAVGLAHNLESSERNAYKAEEVGFELVVHFLLGHGLGVAGQRVAGIVDDHVEGEARAKVGRSSSEGLFD